MPRTISIPTISYEQTAETKEELLAAAFDWLFDRVAEKQTELANDKEDYIHNNKDLSDEKGSSISKNSSKKPSSNSRPAL